MTRFLQTLAKGIIQGARAGQQTNTRILDLATGQAFYRNSSSSDDAARAIEALRKSWAKNRPQP